MSLHATSTEAEDALKRQRRNSMISSMVIGILTVILLMLLLSFFFLAPMLKEVPVIVTYESNQKDTTELEVKKVPQNTERKPSAPSASMARVITANTQSAVAVPVPDVEVTSPSVEFGTDNDFGEGWAGAGDGAMGGGAATFFQQKVSAERIAYVIDYSGSMSGERERLMRAELKKSVSKLPPGMNYQLIFFAGPAWVAGDEVIMPKDRKTAEVKDGGRTHDWKSNGGAYVWEEKGTKRKADWIVASSSTLRKSQKLIESTKLVWGTAWEAPLMMALNMDPAPQIIFFMTDGSAGPESLKIAEDVGRKAKSRGIKVNTVAMMEPKAAEAMNELAKRSGGEFTMIEKGGKITKGKVPRNNDRKKR